MIELRKALHAHIRSIHPNVTIDGKSKSRVYYRRAADGAPLPYLVYSLEVHDDGEGIQRVVLDIDGWDRPATGDTTALETLMAAVNDGMNKLVITNMHLTTTSFLSPTTVVLVDVMADKQFACAFYVDRKLTLDDEDPKIQRRKYIYQGRLFERGV